MNSKALTLRELYFYIPGKCNVEDIATIPADSVNQNTISVKDMYRGIYSGKSLKEYQVENPSIMPLTWEEVEELINDAVRLPVREITEETYLDMLGVMPPLNWMVFESNTSFMLMEMYCGNVTDIFARVHTTFNQYRFFRPAGCLHPDTQ